MTETTPPTNRVPARTPREVDAPAEVAAGGDTEEALPTYIASKVASITLNGGGTNAEVTTADGQRVSLSQIKAIM